MEISFKKHSSHTCHAPDVELQAFKKPHLIQSRRWYQPEFLLCIIGVYKLGIMRKSLGHPSFSAPGTWGWHFPAQPTLRDRGPYHPAWTLKCLTSIAAKMTLPHETALHRFERISYHCVFSPPSISGRQLGIRTFLVFGAMPSERESMVLTRCHKHLESTRYDLSFLTVSVIL